MNDKVSVNATMIGLIDLNIVLIMISIRSFFFIKVSKWNDLIDLKALSMPSCLG